MSPFSILITKLVGLVGTQKTKLFCFISHFYGRSSSGIKHNGRLSALCIYLLVAFH